MSLNHRTNSPLLPVILAVATLVVCGGACLAEPGGGTAHGGGGAENFPLPLEAYAMDKADAPLHEVLLHRIERQPFNLVATVIFLLAILHTFLAGKFTHLSHVAEERHRAKLEAEGRPVRTRRSLDEDGEVSFKAEILHFLGEIEAVFGIWCVPLLGIMFLSYDWPTVVDYFDRDVSYIEPMFVVVIMAIASTRPVLSFSEACMKKVAGIGGGTVVAWWLSILMVAPLLGSFITEPAAMTIASLLLGKMFYDLEPSFNLRYATIGLLFVNISVGGSLTHFAAPPVLMVAGTWGWDMGYMFSHFGWKAALGIFLATTLYWFVFRREFVELNQRKRESVAKGRAALPDKGPVPAWIIIIHVLFLAWTVFNLHNPTLFMGGFLFFMAFTQATSHHQSKIELRTPLLVGFFLAGLVTLGGLQQWWIEPVLGRMSSDVLFWGATVLTSFNDNAAITFLASLVPSFNTELAADPAMAERLQQAVVAGALTGGGLTVIANAPNPAGQSILSKYFGGTVSPLHLLLSAITPTLIMAAMFLLLPG